MSLVKKNSEIAISIITALFVAFGEFNGVAAPWIGILVGFGMIFANVLGGALED